jgi:hypothetical protein
MIALFAGSRPGRDRIARVHSFLPPTLFTILDFRLWTAYRDVELDPRHTSDLADLNPKSRIPNPSRASRLKFAHQPAIEFHGAHQLGFPNPLVVRVRLAYRARPQE